METKAVVGIVLVAAIVGALVFLKIRARRNHYSLKNRGVKDVLIICADGLTGIRKAIQTALPETEYQRCIVHQVRNTLKYVADKDRKAFAKDLKTIYNAPNEEQGRANRDHVAEKWSK